jgi:hypothetical protein
MIFVNNLRSIIMRKYFDKTNLANKKKVILKKLSTIVYLSLYILIFSSIYKSSIICHHINKICKFWFRFALKGERTP